VSRSRERNGDGFFARRVAILGGVLATACIGGCAMDPGSYETGGDAGIEVTLVPVSVIGGPGVPGLGAGTGNAQLGFAAAVAARAGQVFVVDSMAQALVKVDVFGGETRPVLELRDAGTSGLYVTQDLIVYVVDRQSRSVIEVGDNGWERQRFADSRLMPAPVDVTEINWGSSIVIADELSKRLILFDGLSNPVGMMNSTLSPVISVASIGAIASNNGSVFVLDTASREATQLDLQGRLVATYGEDALLAPVAIAADACGRVFVADGHADGLFVSSYDYQGTNARAALPDNIAATVTDLWIDQSELYVAAGPLGVHVYSIQPGCAGR
jgi:DNA-binding beta-propeller fold protein YncE